MENRRKTLEGTCSIFVDRPNNSKFFDVGPKGRLAAMTQEREKTREHISYVISFVRDLAWRVKFLRRMYRRASKSVRLSMVFRARTGSSGITSCARIIRSSRVISACCPQKPWARKAMSYHLS